MIYALFTCFKGTELSARSLRHGRISSVPFIPDILKTYPPELLLYAYTVQFTVLTQGHVIKSS